MKAELFVSNIPSINFEEAEQGTLVKGVEAFKAGTWRGKEYGVTQLNEMVSNFAKFAEEDGSLEPPFKVDHSESARDQIGWVKSLYIEGDSLFADVLVTEPDAVEKMKRGTWKKVSAEIYNNYVEDNTNEDHGMAFRALSIVSIPHLKNIKGIALNSEQIDKDGDFEMTKEEFQEMLDKKFAGIQGKEDFSELKDGFKDDIKAMFSDYEDLKEKAGKAETYKEQAEQLEKEKKASVITGKVAGFSEAGKIVPAQETSLKHLMASFSEKQEEKFNEFMEAAEKVITADEQGNYSEDSGEKTPEEMARELFGE